MSEVIRDSAIKLFGQTIALHLPLPLPLPPADKLVVSDVSLSEQRYTSFATSTSQDSKDESGEDSTESMNHSEEKSTSSEISDDPNSAKKDDSEEKKRPDIVIPCPRCNSMDTKFCYYNNYNVNQPRHFCKKCQRYWTSGGTMRNVAVGSGRRKNKNALLPSYPHPPHITDGIHNAFLISPPGFPVSFYPATLYWGSAVPTMPPAADLSKNTSSSSCSSSILGKHSRIGKENVDAAERRSVLRFQDPSCIWSTLGMKKDKVESKGDRRSRVDHRAMVLQANPAALSRSLNFHESV